MKYWRWLILGIWISLTSGVGSQNTESQASFINVVQDAIMEAYSISREKLLEEYPGYLANTKQSTVSQKL